MKIISIVGARPQFIKLAPLSREFKMHGNRICHKIINTGQHYDKNMSENFFEELRLPTPDYNLNVGSGTHAEQTAKALEKIELILQKEDPDHVIVFGDTNATLSGALAASKLNIPISHIEAGLRSFNRRMPEEINRVITDKLSTYLFCPDQVSVNNLTNEGITDGVLNVGDIMVDQILHIQQDNTLRFHKLEPYVFMTLHRQETCSDLDALKNILEAINKISCQIRIIFSVHPRMQNIINTLHITNEKNFKMILPIGHAETINYVKNAQYIITDSGGLQKEAYLLKVPCITIRAETEWVDTLSYGWNCLVGLNVEKLRHACKQVASFDRSTTHVQSYGDGTTSKKIAKHILSL